MSKAAGSWDSLIKGVSEQVAHQRFPGQHWEQLNMVSDPVRGLARRRGSVMLSEQAIAGGAFNDATKLDARYFGEQSLYLGVTEYSFQFRKAARPAGSTMPGMAVLNKTSGALLPVQVAPSDTAIAAMLNRGINSVTSVGSYVLLAGKGQVTSYNQTDQVNDSGTRNLAVAWIKGGSYSRVYTVAVKNGVTGVTMTAQITTPASYYQGVLDTSDIPALNADGTPNTNYQKLVNDRVYAYQKAVNQWIGTAAAAIQPSAIATALYNAFRAVGMPASDIGVINSTIVFGNASAVSVDDGGDGSQALGVGRVVKQVSDLSTMHYPGKVVKIQPQNNSAKAYYVKAVAKDASITSWTQVTWEETAGILITPALVMAVGVVSGGSFFVASTPAILQAIVGFAIEPWTPSTSGDLESQQLPAFLGKEITYIRMFQDRLIIVAGATVFMSRSGDYFNFFRQSALTLQDNDPIEIYALGSDDDVITAGTLLDRNLILFGKQWQYAVPGRDAITPTSAFVAVQSGYKDSNDCPPETSGDLIFFTQQRNGKLTMQQMQTGAYADTLVAIEVTQQLNKYLNGAPQQVVAVTSPNAVFVRTNALDNGFWVYSYLDSGGNDGRLFDSWSKWTFAASLGQIVSMSAKDGDLIVTTLRATAGGGCYLVADKFTLNTDVPMASHMDSRRPYNTQGTLGYALNIFTAACAGAYTNASGRYWMLGDTLGPRLDALRAQVGGTNDVNMEIGALFESSVTLTNPYRRDREGKAILDSRLTLSNLNVTLFESAAMSADVIDLVNSNSEPVPVMSWIARQANAWVLNTQQVTDNATVVVGVYKEIRDAKVRLKSRSWLPWTISAIEWSGQYFTRRG